MTIRERLAALKIGLGLDGVRGQIAGLVLASVIASQLIIAAAFLINRPDAPPLPQHEPQQLTVIAQLLARTAPAQRPPLIDEIASAFPWIELTAAAPAPEARPLQRLPAEAHELRHHLGPDYRITLGDDHRLSITLPDGDAIRARVPADHPHPPLWGSPWLLSLLIGAVSVALLGLWAARALAAPLSSFAAAAESFSLQTTGTPLPERGPAEIRSLARALNRMRERITTMIDERTKMLAAISHDLRTPITRMRLRAEFIEDPQQRTQTLHDLDQMAAMLTAVLSFLRGAERDAPTRIDLASALQLIADQFCDIGAKVSYQGPGHALATARPSELQRAITNLVENAVRYGSEVIIRLAVRPELITIEVVDDGPGIADADKTAVLQPFVRGDHARDLNDSTSFGLGLSIAQTIAHAHGGELSLHDRVPGGLVARITLPQPSTDTAHPASR